MYTPTSATNCPFSKRVKYVDLTLEMALLYSTLIQHSQHHGMPTTVISKVTHLSRDGAKPNFRPKIIIPIANETN